MKTTILTLLLLSSMIFARDPIRDSIVQVSTTHRAYDYESPWAPPYLKRSGGSGFIIEGSRIVTNAHVIMNASFIEIRSASSHRWYEAEVKVVAHDCDLAILEVKDPSFFEGKLPLNFGSELLYQQEEVSVYGFPIGGRELSVTKGIVSRIDITSYAHSGAHLLTAQIDAPLNPGNSGGPVLSEGQVVGVAHQGILPGRNIGYMIPIPIIKHFLEEVDLGEYVGFPEATFSLQPIRNPAMRKYYRIEEEIGGLLVVSAPSDHDIGNLIERGDILLEVDHHPIDSSGRVKLKEYGISLPFQYLIMMKHFGDPIDLLVMRKGSLQEFSCTITHSQKAKPLVKKEFDKPPSYFIIGGIVFQPLVENYLRAIDFDQLHRFVDVLYHVIKGNGDKDRDEVVVLSSVLDDAANVGYQHLEKKIVDKVNGKKIRSLISFISEVDKVDQEYIFITTQDGVEIILDRDLAIKRNPVIMNRYLINSDRSVDLQ